MSETPSGYKGNVLFVDDSQVNLILGKKLLSNLGLTVKTAENGLQAIDLCKNNVFQLIFMDLEMPQMDGLNATSIIRKEKLSYAPIYALTGSDSDKIRLLCQAAHMNGIIEKPFRQEKIVSILNNIFGTAQIK